MNNMVTEFERILVSSYKNEMIIYLENNPEAFDEAIKLAVSDKPLFSRRAAWLLWSFIENNDPRIDKHIDTFVNALTGRDEDHQREILKILMKTTLPEEHEVKLLNHSITLWQRVDNKASVRFNAFKMITKITRKHPELIGEIMNLTDQRYLDTLSAGARKSILGMYNSLNKENREN